MWNEARCRKSTRAAADGRWAQKNVSPSRQTNNDMSKRERFGSGWSGAVSVALFAYIAIAIALILVDGKG